MPAHFIEPMLLLRAGKLPEGRIGRTTKRIDDLRAEMNTGFAEVKSV